MMNKKRTREIGRTKYLLFLPLAALLLLISNIEAVARTTKEIAKEVLVAVDENMTTQLPQEKITAKEKDQEDLVFEVVENMPQFAEGGIPGLMNYLSKNIQYPANAKKNGVQGRITVQFIVNVDGSITNVKLFNKIDPELDAEAIRVISNMPKWKPGTQKGKAVRVRYSVPIMFKSGENKTNKKNQITSSKIDETVVVAAYTPTEVEASSGEKIYEVVEEMPSFVGGIQGLMNYLSSNIKYPVEAQKAKAQGRATVQVIINKEGNVTAPRIIRTSGNALLDAEAIRVVSTMPKWSPGTQRGKPVSVKYTMPIMFRLQ